MPYTLSVRCDIYLFKYFKTLKDNLVLLPSNSFSFILLNFLELVEYFYYLTSNYNNFNKLLLKLKNTFHRENKFILITVYQKKKLQTKK